jgi:transposase
MRCDPVTHQLREIPVIGLLTSTALRATVGNIQRFDCARRFSSSLGLTPRECSSGDRGRSPSAVTFICARCRSLVLDRRCCPRSGNNAAATPSTTCRSWR